MAEHCTGDDRYDNTYGIHGWCNITNCEHLVESDIETCVVPGVTHRLCPSGYYCPDGEQAFRCPVGYFCPLGSPHPNPCSIDLWREENNITDSEHEYNLENDLYNELKELKAGLYCGGGVSKVSKRGPWCREGYHCPDVKTQIQCDEYTFSHTGFTECLDCPDWSYCPKGASTPQGAIALFAGLSVV
eukprot:UN30732